MKCKNCGGPVDEHDDAVAVLLKAGKINEAFEIFGSGYHLNPHPEFNCPGHSAARQIAPQSVITDTQQS